jgi:tetratricopeptide (TPR) repeat protein
MVPAAVAAEASADPETAWKSMALRAQQQRRQYNFAEAAETGKQALQMAKRFGPTDGRLATTYYLMGSIYRDWGHCVESRTNFSHAIAIGLKRPTPQPRFVFNSITSLIVTMCECDDFANAEKLFHSYEADMHRYRTDTLDDAKILSMEAVLARGKKNLTKAEATFRECIAMMEKAPDATGIEIGAERSNLAVVLYQQHRYTEALAESEKVIAYFENAAPRHHSMLAALNNSACALAGLGRKDESERVFNRAVQLAQDLYGEDNRTSARIMLNYARVLRENKETPAAAAWQQRGAEAFHRSLVRERAVVDVTQLQPKN